LAEILRERGYATGAIVNTDFLTRKFGFDQGFDDFREPILHKGAAKVVDGALSFLREHAGEPAFLFVHFFDVHGPYDDAPHTDDEGASSAADWQHLRRIRYHDYLELDRFRSLAELRAGYEAGVQRVDAELGRFFAALRKDGVYDDALIVVTADHGEEFFEHEIWVGHGPFLYDSELRIPMILKLPAARGLRGEVVATPVSLIDVMPTILEIVGAPVPPSAQGQSLLGIIAAPPADRNVFGQSSNTGNTEFIRSRRWKFISPLRERPATLLRRHLRPEADVAQEVSRRIVTGPQLFDLSIDGGETTNLAGTPPDVVETMTRLLEAQRQEDTLHARRHLPERAGQAELSESERERLRSLGVSVPQNAFLT
jgi:arylsulfatase A-like enzyme